MEFNILCQKLYKYNYKNIGNYIESVDGWIYFTCEWDNKIIYVKYYKDIVIVECDQISNWILESVHKQIKRIILT